MRRPILVSQSLGAEVERFVLAAVEAEDRAGELGERAEISRLLERVTGQHRRKAYDLCAVVVGLPADERVKTEHHIFEGAASAVDARHGCLDQQSRVDEVAEK